MFWIGETDYPLADRFITSTLLRVIPCGRLLRRGRQKSSFSAQITRQAKTESLVASQLRCEV